MNTIGVGIDTARYGHRVTFLDESRQPAAPPLTIQETWQGYRCLEDTLCQLQSKFPQATLRVRIDAAGHYAANLESFLRKLPLRLQISLGQPKQNKDYQQVHFPKRKSDDTDSRAVARFAVVEAPPPTAACQNGFRTKELLPAQCSGSPANYKFSRCLHVRRG